MNDAQILCFLEAARCLNFTEAAEHLYLSQSVLSRRISSLERELNVQLFLRHKKTVRLTPAGVMLAEGLFSLRDQYSELFDRVWAANTGVVSVLRVGCLEEQMLGPVITKALKQFSADYPNVELILSRESYKNLRDGLYSGALDLAIAFEMDIAGRKGLSYQVLRSCPNFLVVPADHPNVGKPNLSLADFQDDVFLNVSAEESELVNRLLPGTCREAGFTPKIKVAPSFGTLSLWLEAGYGIFGLNANHILSCNPDFRFLSVPELPPVNQVIAWASGNPDPSIARFSNALVDAFSESTDDESRL